MVFPDAVLSEEDIAKFVGHVSAPVSINMGLAIRKRPTTPLVSIKRLEELGVARVTFPRMTTAAALSGMKKALEVILESIAQGKIIERPDLCFGFEELSSLMGVPQMKELEERFLTEEALTGKYGHSR
jgi:2-methylisocitrate lyase-like PEP mutase family enzyme